VQQQRKGKANTVAGKKKQIALERVKGATLAEIGKKVGLSPKTVEKYVADPQVKAWMQHFAAKHEGSLNDSYRVAVETLTRLMQGDDAKVSLEAIDRLIHLLGTTDKAMAPGKGQQDQGGTTSTYTLAELTVSLERYVSTIKS